MISHPLVCAECVDGALVLRVAYPLHSRHPAQLLHMSARSRSHGLALPFVQHQLPRQFCGTLVVIGRVQVPCTELQAMTSRGLGQNAAINAWPD